MPQITDADALAEAFASPHTFAHAMTEGAYTLAPHIDIMAAEIKEAFAVPGSRKIIEGPPRHSKSELGSHWGPSWGFCLWPERKVIVASHSSELATDFGREVRNTIDGIGENFPSVAVRLRQDSKAAGRWHTNMGGGMRCVGVGSKVTGFGAHVILIDDPYGTAEEAYSDTIRKKVWTWYTSTLRDRTQPGWPVSIVIMQQRWHEDDLAGRLQREQPGVWDVTTLRAICEEGDDDPLGRQPGEALWPDGYPIEILRQTEAEMGPMAFGAKFQQHPRPAEGSIWKRAWFEGRTYSLSTDRILTFNDGYTCPLSSTIVYATTDLAGSKKDQADWTAIITWGVCPDGRIVVLDVAKDRAAGPETIERSKGLSSKWRWSIQWVEVTGKLEFVDTMRTHGLPIRTIGRSADDGLTLKGDKVSVAYAATPTAEAKRIWLPEHSTWCDSLVSELLSFPVGNNDDQADAFAWGLLIGRDLRPPRRRSTTERRRPAETPLERNLAKPW